ncbi:MAG: sugar ABC transporter permease [Defluviitaleaceae bacterium]|nr:sugar ABC transporter permease [Defluviitaleaceae bacterium]
MRKKASILGVRRSYIKKAIVGYLFISPFLVGFIFLFLGTLLQTFEFSRSFMSVGPDGYVLTPVGWDNFRRLFFVDPDFAFELVRAVFGMLPEVAMIIIFSFFTATLINQKFMGRSLARAVLFLPIILTSGVVLALEMNDAMLLYLSDVSGQAMALDGDSMRLLNSIDNMLGNLFITVGNFTIDPAFMIVMAIDNIYDIIIASGVQILVFLAGLQSIPPSLYEASTVEGATGWENFWKITFPMISPLVLVNVVYTIIDSFTRPTNEVMGIIHSMAFGQLDFGGSSAAALVYFLLVILALGIVVGLLSRWVFYYD